MKKLILPLALNIIGCGEGVIGCPDPVAGTYQGTVREWNDSCKGSEKPANPIMEIEADYDLNGTCIVRMEVKTKDVIQEIFFSFTEEDVIRQEAYIDYGDCQIVSVIDYRL